MKNIKIIILYFFLLNFPLFSAEYNSHIIKIKNNIKNDILQSNKFNITPIFSNNNDKNSSWKNYNDLQGYYVLNNYNELSLKDKKILLENVEFIEANYIYKIEKDNLIPNDNLIKEQWGLEAVNAYKAWNLASGKGILIGMIDTGIDYYHKDLINNLYVNPKEDINNNGRFDCWKSDELRDGVYGDLDGIDNDGNGVVDDVIGYDFVDEYTENFGDSKNIDPDVFDEHGHGTLVAGVMIAERNNEIGISGTAFNSKLITARAFNYFGNGQSDDIAKSIVYLVNNGAKIINCSFGDKYYSRLVEAAIKYAYSKSCVIVASSGNNNWDRVHYPSDHEYVISVGAANKNLKKTFLSNYGYNLNLLAPGENIITTAPGDSYKLANGTSLATPFVTSAVALLLEKNPNLTINEIKTILEITATPLSSAEFNKKEGSGMLDIYNAILNSKPSEISIKSPNEFTSFRFGIDNDINIIGSVFTPLFERYEITLENYYLDEGVDKTYLLFSSDKQVINDTLAKFKNIGRSIIVDREGNRIELANADVIIRLKVFLKNGKTIQRSKLIEIINDEKLLIDKIDYFPTYCDGVNKICLNINTNYNSYLSVYSNESDEINNYYSDLDLYNKYHTVILNPRIRDDNSYSYKIKVNRRDLQEIDTTISIKLELNDFQNNSYNLKDYSLNYAADVDCKVFDYNNDGNDNIIVNSLGKEHNWEKMKILSFQNNEFKTIYDANEVVFPSAYGKLNGDNIILCLSTINSIVYKFNQNELIPNEIFRDYHNTALGFYDFDKDGNDELITLKRNTFSKESSIHDSLVILKYDNNKNEFKYFFNFSLNNGIEDIGTFIENTRLVIDNFDYDNQEEFIITNKYSNIILLKYDNSKHSFEKYIIDNDTNTTEVFQVLNADIDGDGIAEIIKISDFIHTNKALFEFPNQVSMRSTKIEVFKYIDGVYNKLNNLTKYFYNTKTNFLSTLYNYGISASDLDNQSGEELIVSLFPNLYIFKYNKETDKLETFFHKNGIHSEAPLVNDFDKNGIKEIGYSTLNSVEFIEINPNEINYKAPFRLYGYSKDNNEYVVKWTNPKNSLKTQIWINDALYSETNSNSYILKNYSEIKGTIFLKADYGNNNISVASEKINFYISNGNYLNEFKVNSNFIKLLYSEKVPIDIEKLYFKVYNENKILQEIKAVILYNENGYLITFEKELKPGKYTLKIESFFDYYSNITQEYKGNFEIFHTNEEDFLYFKRLKVVSKNPPRIELQFSDIINSSAFNIANYILEPNFTIQSISQSENNDSTVIIQFKENELLGALGREYYISSNTIESINHLKMKEGKGDRISFVFTANDIFDTWVYPNPVNFDKEEELYFANLPNRAIIKIYSIDGILLNSLFENDGNGGLNWDGRDKNGDKLNTGVYLYQVEDYLGNKSNLNKLVIIK